MKEIKKIRIFISSPGDVGDERRRARQIIEGMGRRYAGQILLDPLFWEDLPLQPHMTFQQQIDEVLLGEKSVDIAVFILWSRFGSSPGPATLREDRSEYDSGTEREYDLMKRARANNSAARPDILIYTRRDDTSFHERLREKEASKITEISKQKELVEAFIKREFNDPVTGANTGAHHDYGSPHEFTQLLRAHLQTLLDGMTDGLPQQTVWNVEMQGPPFMGLAVFQPHHAAVFFGREEEVMEARLALQKQARNGCGFLLLLGSSGSGKSSLARAGILPSIVEYEVDGQVAQWRSLVITPSELAPESGTKLDLVTSFVRRLAMKTPQLGMPPEPGTQSLPELICEGSTAETIASAFKENPTLTSRLTLLPAMERASASAKGEVRLLLILDQLEELFTASWITKEDRIAFLEMIEALARTGKIWVVATARSDFYQQLQSEPALVRLRAGNGQMDVLPPGADALRRLVESPAKLAGLVFEEKDLQGHRYSLADVILKDAASHAELLPLLEDLLRELFEKRSGVTLTFESYKLLGGSVEKALALRADKVFESLADNTVRDALPSVFQSLITIGTDRDSDGKEVVPGAEIRLVRQKAALAAFSKDSPARMLIDDFVAARLFTTGKHPETGIASVTVAHESLLRVWPRAVQWADANREFLRVRARIASRMEEGSPVLEGDPLLNSAVAQLAAYPKGFQQAERDFVEASAGVAQGARTRRRRIQLSLVAAAALSIIGGIFYYYSQREQDALARQFAAEAERDLVLRDFARAEVAAAVSLTYRDQPETRELLLKSKSGGLHLLANSARIGNNATLCAFSRDGNVMASVQRNRKAVEVKSTLDGTIFGEIDITSFDGPPECMALSDGGGTPLLAMAKPDHSVAIWRFAGGKASDRPQELSMPGNSAGIHSKRVPSLAFHPGKPWIATCSEDRKLCLWDYGQDSARLIHEQPEAHGTAVHGIAFNMNGALLASGGGDYLVKLWKVEEMAADDDGKTPFRARKVAPDKILSGHSDSVFAVAFSPDGKRLASGGYDRLIRIWDLTLPVGELKKKPEGGGPDKPDGKEIPEERESHPVVGTLYGNEGTVLDLKFSDDNSLLVSGGKDETVRVWDAAEGRVLIALRPDCGVIRSVACRKFDEPVRCGGENGWSIWSAAGRDLGARLWQGANAQAMAFDPQECFFATGGGDGVIHIWDKEYHPVKDLTVEGLGGVNGIAISSDGRWLAAAGEGKSVFIWDTKNDWKVQQASGKPGLPHDGPIWGLCFDPMGRWLASGNADSHNRIKRWNIPDWTLKDETTDLADSIYTLSTDPKGRWLISGDSLAKVAVRNAEDLSIVDEEINVKQGETNVWSTAVCPEPLAILSGNSDGKVYRWTPDKVKDWNGGKPGKKISISDADSKINHTINSVSYSTSDRWVAAGGDGGSIEIYDANLQKVRSLVGHDGTVWLVTFNSHGTRLASGGSDKIVRIWNIEVMKRNWTSDSPRALYEEATAMTGMAVKDGKIVVVRKP